MTDQDLPSGLIIKAQSGFFFVLINDSEHVVTCQLRGRLKHGRREGDIAAVGDRVLLSIETDGSGSIEEILERKNQIVRLDPRPQGEYRQILLANADQAIFVFACAKPDPHVRMLDRFLVIAEKQLVPSIIVFNKADLVDVETMREKYSYYTDIGYRMIFTSTVLGLGVEELKEAMAGKLSALAGPSGVGKSSLMNAIQPDLGVKVDNVSQFTDKGKHTTNFRQLHRLLVGGWVADAPGWKSLALWDTYPEEVDAYFPEIAPLVEECKFSDCSHTHEPGCAVVKAVADGKVSEQRYDSYLRLRSGQE
jgi:ribosome biogenesis GTPase